MTPQERNEAMLLNLWNIGETMFDGMLNQITKQVELAEQPDDECPTCFGHGEYTLARSDSDWGEVVKCDCPAGRKL